MRLPMLFLAGATALMGGAAQAAAPVEIRDAVVRVTVIPEDRPDVVVNIVKANPDLPLQIRKEGDRTVIDGNLKRRMRSCDGNGEGASVRVNDLGTVRWADMPQIVIRTPREVNIASGGAVYGAVGRSAALELGNAGCGDWVVGDTKGRMRISSAGSGQIRTGRAGEATLRLAGSGDITVRGATGGLAVDLAGSGDVDVGSSNGGSLDVKIAGSGDVNVREGKATSVTALIAGSGDLNFGGTADSLTARIMGSGDVHTGRVSGSVSRNVMGSGKVTTSD